jgi:multidrug efflux pump subunit AcrB
MVQNPVAANMLMILILGGGLAAAVLIPRELFPEFSVDFVTVSVPYPGATPEDVEKSICLKIEDKLDEIEEAKEITSTSREGMGVVAIELEAGTDVRAVLDDVRSEVDKITFPDRAEDPTVAEVTLRRHVIHVAVAGEAPERTLKELAEEIRDELNELPEISQVSISGVREEEITVEVSEEALRRHEITLEQIAQTIRASSFDLPAGDIKTPGGEVTVRVVGEKRTAEEMRNIVLLSKPNGTVVRLADVAQVQEGFEDVDVGGQFNGQPAALVSVYKTADEDSIDIATAVREYVADKRSRVPEGVTLQVWSDTSKVIRDRLDMLVHAGVWGLMLVFVILWFFLGARLSLWVSLGIPLSVLGTLLVLHLTGMSLNMMSMFALIMALGLIVDDAIVVGENVYSGVERGQPPRLAAVEGTHNVLLPVVAAVATTWAAFVPLTAIPGVMGRFIEILPVTVILALAFSLVECILILPPHLAHSLRARRRLREAVHGPMDWLAGIRRRLDNGIRWFIDGPFVRLYRLATRYRYATLGVFVGAMLVMAAAVRAGFVPLVGFPKVQSDTLRAQVTLETGTRFDRTADVARRISLAALELNEEWPTDDGKPLVRHVYSLLGQTSGRDGETGSHLCEVIVELTPAEQRAEQHTTDEIVSAWRRRVGPVPGAVKQDFGAFRGGPGGKALEIRLLGPETDYVKPAAERLKAELATFAGVTDISDDALPGKMEMRVRLREGAENLGIRLQTLAAQLRDAFYGNESVEIQRGREEVEVMVRYPPGERTSPADVESMRVRTGSGAEVPFPEVAEVRMKRGYTTLRRVGRSSVVTVSADVDEKVANAEQILGKLSADGGLFEQLRSRYPRMRLDLRGQRQQIFESLNALYVLFPLAMLVIYTILAALFRSYVQPMIIMIAIPFGLVGAVVGHWLLGFDVTLLSMFGMVALAGIVVNDSLVLIDRMNRHIRSGGGVLESAEQGARSRFRPIILTTLTTVAGITPLLFERSFQAQFLKPMAVSIAFGLMFATLLTLLLVPSLYLIGNDLRRAFRWLLTGQWVSPDDVAKRAEPMPEPAE